MFSFMYNKKTIIIILAVILGLKLITLDDNGILYFLLTIPGILIALTFHEFAHAWAANKLGDETPKTQGRLNLNPLSHIDPVGFVFLIVAGFGWGKPVQIDIRNFKGKYSISKAEAIVSAAGPIMNFILAFVFMIVYYLLFQITSVMAGLSYDWQQIIEVIIVNIISINIGLGVFNLLPFPPLDGSKILIHFLPYKAKEWFYRNGQIFYLVFLLLIITGLATIIILPIFDLVFYGMQWVVYNIFKLLTLI